MRRIIWLIVSASRLVVAVKPASKHPGIELTDDGVVLRVRERPIDGAANEACVKALASYLQIPRSRVRLVRGESSRHKTFEIDGIDAETALARLTAQAKA